MKLGVKLRFNSGIWPDISILLSTVSGKLKRKLVAKLNDITDSRDLDTIISVLTNFAQKYFSNQKKLSDPEAISGISTRIPK